MVSKLGVVKVASVHLGSHIPGPREFFDLTIDSRGLLEMFDGDDEVTRLNSDWDSDRVRTEHLNRLMGQHVAPPDFAPRFHRTRLDRLLGRRGTPYAFSESAFEDGRVGLLYCRCGDMDCGVLSAKIEFTTDRAVWHEIGWQVPCEPPRPAQVAGGFVTVGFAREQYELVLHSLLSADWTDGLPPIT